MPSFLLAWNRVAHKVRPAAPAVEKDSDRFIADGLLDEYACLLALEAGYGNGVRILIAMVFKSHSLVGLHQFGRVRQALKF